MACVVAIYIFCRIYESLGKLTDECDYESITMSFLAKSKSQITTSVKANLYQLRRSFICSISLKEIILEILNDNIESMNDLVKYCKENQLPKNGLEEFQNDYDKKTSVSWYRGKIFISPTLNPAFRTQGISSVAKLGFFIRNLHP